MTTQLIAPPGEALAAPLAPRAAELRHPVRGDGWRRVRTVLWWLARTLLVVVPVFLFSTLITFALGAASGLNPAAALAGDNATPEMIAQINAQYGLDQPFFAQYLQWIGGVLTGDLGTSWFNNTPVAELIGQRLAISASIAGFALVLGVVFGTLLGLVAAVNQGRFVDRAVTAVASFMSTLPPFVVSIGLIVVLSIWLHLLPSAGYVPPQQDFWRWLSLITMPAIALSLDTVAELARQLRTGLVSTLHENYITGAVVRGLSRRRVLFGHALRNGAGPAVAILGMKVPTLLGGAVVTETIFSMPGFGMLSADSALRGDVPVVQGTLVVAIVLVLFCNVVVNVVLGSLRPASRRGR
ncbi:ABC transporter permease [Herbiconiux sp. KACC 21604]|uniref:ABC transporter permease n=1 Tax=unclassified Herbiconiux TaxID=2618217 RepID=UPI0014913EB9|nr:ABC transporter permease [Herbiconiux sp. SALV-R1]QJU53897.1 ABC transporter permease [Herbiconiux sp. SALV-R1]WPO84915.1 ABC transporter permease [Herbiconiux sp. KACC 21604]